MDKKTDSTKALIAKFNNFSSENQTVVMNLSLIKVLRGEIKVLDVIQAMEPESVSEIEHSDNNNLEIKQKIIERIEDVCK